MNDQPHTHAIKINRYLRDEGCLRVTYGDTEVLIKRWWQDRTRTNHPRKKMIRKAVLKAIRLHDEGSRKAGERERRERDDVNHVLAEFGNMPGDHWAHP